jgi:hypothetical protein
MTYDELMEILHRAVPGDWLHNKEHGIFTNRHDLDIRIERAPSGGQDDTYIEHWACISPGSEARTVRYRLYYGSSMVEEFKLVEVEAGEAQLPMPRHGVRLTVSTKDYALARAVDVSGRLDEYMKLCDISVHQ